MEKHILVIDSDTKELRRLREVLTKEGFSIMTATDKATAMEICQRIPIGFVLAEASALGFDKSDSSSYTSFSGRDIV
ncbi:MAG TPA: hypothetical protein VL633_10975 [Bacteroidota bacterium]|jgi:PleD family two-component response regulator|nr:hypothetical protein [Bacteroidota bacterium]